MIELSMKINMRLYSLW